ncbi:aromatic ring-hydroxylating dioxygenase subunit alpha [Arthrobacter sp. efr-133-TYG-118]|uniref:aromatic ring-hydroxylating oxygenase subunit alpha n=1 Tax=Arthrobacter sp. efr-133-TYG-118 TaxID=3040279 RepID=UPI00254EC552|nr:aromatic ring-hydroxylating dioxygenase subunit alpha [Arthrobacter sp. efr-133-TYG-118]
MVDLNELVDSDRGRVDPRIYTDPGVYERELEFVFGRSWLFLAHDSQLPKTGSFIQTYMAEDPVLVVRQRDGSVKAFLNQCRHRGMRICRADAGVSKTFTCTYHGWAYDLEGNLINVPLEDRAYKGNLDREAWGALKVPRIANYRGFYFGTWSDETPDFEDYLGDMAFYFDAVADRFDSGLEFTAGTTKWVIDCNWKFAAEQFGGDMYHTSISHASGPIALTDQQVVRGDPNLVQGRQFGGDGHGSGGYIYPERNMPPNFFRGQQEHEFTEDHLDEIEARIGDTRMKKVNNHNTIFPNFSWLGFLWTMRVWHPRGPNQIEVWTWSFVPKDATEALKREIREKAQRTFSPAGVFETDDGENWTEVQQVLHGFKARQNTFHVGMGLGHEERNAGGLPGVTNDVFSEVASRGFYRRWHDLLVGKSWKQIQKEEAARVSAIPESQPELAEGAR